MELTPEQLRDAITKAPPGVDPQDIINAFSERGYNVAGVEPQPVMQPTETRSSFFKQDLTGGALRDRQNEGFFEGMGKDVFSSTIGSRGLVGAGQLPGLVAGQGMALKTRTQTAQSAGALADATTKLIQQRREETNPRRKEALAQSINQNLKTLNELNAAGADVGRFERTPGQALGTAINAGVTALTFGRNVVGPKAVELAGRVAPQAVPAVEKAVSVGRGIVPRVVEGGAIGAGYQAAANLNEGEPVSEDVLSAILLGAAIPVAGTVTRKVTSGVQSQIADTSGRVMNSVLKPLAKDFAYGRNPGATVAKERIVASNLDDLATKISQRKNEVGRRIEQTLTSSNKTVDMSDAFAPLDKAIEDAQRMPTTNASIINRLEGIKSDLKNLYSDMGTMTVAEANKVKQDVGNMTRWTGNNSDDEMTNKALKSTYGAINEKVTKAVPEIVELNETYGGLLSAEIAAKYRDKIVQRQNLVGLGVKAGGVGAGIVTVLANPAMTVPVIMLGATAAAVDKALASPAVKTRVAKWLASASRQELETVYKKLPLLKHSIERVFGNELKP
jgi:hypothetical protein